MKSVREERWLNRLRAMFSTSHDEAQVPKSSADHRPWEHPYLSHANISAFRQYSEQVWAIALEHAAKRPRHLKCAFSVNMAQNMYRWARLACKYGAEAELFLHPLDNTALSLPEWEEFDGEFADVLDGPGFRASYPYIHLEVPVRRKLMDPSPLYDLACRFQAGDRKPLLRAVAGCNSVRYEVLLRYAGFYPYWDWAQDLARFDVIYTASTPFAAYASGRPYCAFSVGADLQFDCGRADALGEAMTVAFNAARFLLVTNPHTLGHCRRLGFSNGLYLPYPMDSDRYCPGEGLARGEWQARYGGNTFVLATARLDRGVKGQTPEMLGMLAAVAAERPDVRFMFVAWGKHANDLEAAINAGGLRDRFIFLRPVGKKRLIDYYRSCDIVLDQFVYGYYGATALEASAIGKPVLINLRREQYDALYHGDVTPMSNAEDLAAMRNTLVALLDNPSLREDCGRALRTWLVRNHGEQHTVPLMLALLQFAADRVELPRDLRSPLLPPESDEEAEYHESRLMATQ